MTLIFLKCILQNITHGIMRFLLRVIILFLYIILLLIVLTWPAIQYPINISSILVILSTKCLIPLKYAEPVGLRQRTKEVDDTQHFRVLPKQNLIPTQFMLRSWGVHLLEVLGH